MERIHQPQSYITKQASIASGHSKKEADAPQKSILDLRPMAMVQRQLASMANGGIPNRPLHPNSPTTTLPIDLQQGAERLSGISLKDVTVHYNSSKPAQLQALAFAQGNQIHLGSGQERHLPHETWHVVQQKQGRVKPTLQMKTGVQINDDQRLEREADVMGAKAVVVGSTRNQVASSLPHHGARYFQSISTQLKLDLPARCQTCLMEDGVLQMLPSARLLEKKRFIENRIRIINRLGPNPTRSALLAYDIQDLEALVEHDADGQQMKMDLLNLVQKYREVSLPKLGLAPKNVGGLQKLRELRGVFQHLKPEAPDQEQLANHKYHETYTALLGKFHTELNEAANKLGFKVLARFNVVDGKEGIIHPGLNSWARFEAFKPSSPDPIAVPRVLRTFSKAEIDKLAEQHMKKGHDTGEQKGSSKGEQVLMNSPLISGTEDVEVLIKADSRFSKKRLEGLTGMPSRFSLLRDESEAADESPIMDKSSRSGSRLRTSGSFLRRSPQNKELDVSEKTPTKKTSPGGSSLLRATMHSQTRTMGATNIPESLLRKKESAKGFLAKKDFEADKSTKGKGVSDRIVKLIWGFDSEEMSFNMNTRSPVAVANTLSFFVIPLDYAQLYTPESVKADEQDCCTLERENTVFAQLNDINELVIGSLPNYFPLMQIFNQSETPMVSQREDYRQKLLSRKLASNQFINILKYLPTQGIDETEIAFKARFRKEIDRLKKQAFEEGI